MCDPYYEDCPAPCDPYYEDCAADVPDRGNYDNQMAEETISTMPINLFIVVSATMVFGSLYVYNEELLTMTNGSNYKGMAYATQLTWTPILVSGIAFQLFGDEVSYEIFCEAMWSGVAGPIAYNWFGMAWAEYQRQVVGTSDFTSSDNMTSLGINFGWNLVNIGLYRYLVTGILEMEHDYMMSQKGMMGPGRGGMMGDDADM